MDTYSGLNRYLVEIEKEKKFVSLVEASCYVLEKWEKERELLAIYTKDQKMYYALHMPLDEISIELGFKPVIDILRLLNIRKSGNTLEEELKNYL